MNKKNLYIVNVLQGKLYSYTQGGEGLFLISTGLPSFCLKFFFEMSFCKGSLAWKNKKVMFENGVGGILMVCLWPLVSSLDMV